jgi:HK97 family phage major capsid protein
MNRIQKLVDERNELAAGITYVRSALDAEDIADDDFTAGVDYCRTSTDALAELDRKISDLEAIAAVSADPRSITRGDAPTVIVKRDLPDAFDTRDLGPMTSRAELVGRARTAIEQVVEADDVVREAATRTIERAIDPRGDVARRILLTGSEAYRSGFQKVAGGDTYGLTEAERDAMSRAASLTGNAGGFAVPFTLDPTVILTNTGAVNSIRQLARTVQITTDQWNGVSSAGVTASFDAEAAEVSDDAPTLAQPSIDVRMGRAFVPFSIEIGMDWASMEADVRNLIVDAKDRLEATVLWSGASGSNQPIGIETALAGVAGSMVAPITAEVFAVGDISRLYAAVPPRYRASASMGAIAEFSTLAEIRRLLATTNDRSSFNEATATTPTSLYGWPILEHSTADPFSAVNPAATATNHLIVAGDWSNYVIVDRVGMNVELVPHLFAMANNLPSGQRGFFAYWRTGADSVNDDAFRVFRIVTAA